MASTYSPNLLLELQATGENDGVWGVKLNTDLTQIDSFAGGRLNISVAGGSNVTISDTQARNSFHFLTGLLTGNIDYIVPNRGRYFWINNGTTGAFTVTVKQSGGSGIVVPQGFTMLVLVNPDTTSVTQSFNYFSSLTLGSIALSTALGAGSGGTGLSSYTAGDMLYASGTTTLSKLAAAASGNALLSGSSPSWGKVGLTTHVSGVLPVANGGTNASAAGLTALNNISGLSIAGVTGSGNLVLGTSPTLASPTLGTPASGNLVNCTGYAGANVTGLGTAAFQNTTAFDASGAAAVAQAASLQKTSNLSDLNNASTARNNLGLGSAATQSSAAFDAAGAAAAAQSAAIAASCQRASNLSDVASASTSRTNLGLGSWATKNQTVSTSSPSGTPADGDVWIKYTP